MLPLRDVCLLFVRNCIVDGTLSATLEAVPALLRQQIFRTLAMAQRLSDENSLRYMKHSMFFNDGFSTVDILPAESRYRCRTPREVYRGFLEFFVSTVQTVPNLADSITTLRLVYEIDPKTISRTNSDSIETHRLLSSNVDDDIVLQLIGRCKNLKSLCLVISDGSRFLQGTNYLLWDLTEAVRQAGSSGLEELELHNLENYTEFQLTPPQTLVFQKLKYLRLENVILNSKIWRNLLECCQLTLETLVLDEFRHRSALIGIRMQQLKRLIVRRVYTDQHPLDVAKHCPSLMHYDFDVYDGKMVSGELSELKTLLLSLGGCSIAVRDEMSRDPAVLCALVDVAGANIAELDLIVHPDFTEEHVNRLVSGLSNLMTLVCNNVPGEPSVGLRNQFLNAFFRDKVRAEKLLELRLKTSIPERTAELLFSNCVRLKKLKLSSHMSINDQHMLLWTERGARPCRLDVSSSLSHVGLGALIQASGMHLRELECFQPEWENVDAIVERLVNHCPLLERIVLNNVSARLCSNYSRFGKRLFYAV